MTTKMTMKSEQYAVFGHPIRHSLSPRIHTLFAQQTQQKEVRYEARDVPADSFDTTLRDFFNQGGRGINCTVPLKELAWQCVDHTSERAALSKAVNTIALQADGRLYGDNTDGIGLIRDLCHNLGLQLQQSSILILGAGGATRGIIAPILAQQPATLVIANRTVTKAVRLADEFSPLGHMNACGFDELAGSRFDLVLNATAASLSGDLPPLPESLLNSSGSCYDLAYSAQATPFVLWGRQQQARISVDGLGMLVEQAAEAFELWRGIRPETIPVIEALRTT